MVHYEKNVPPSFYCRTALPLSSFLSLASMILGFLFLYPFDAVRVKSYMHAYILPSVCGNNCNQSKKNFVSRACRISSQCG